MNSRLEALIKRGYSKELVEELALFTNEELEYASFYAFKHISRGCIPVSNPTAFFIGGQPGSGKTVMSMNLKNELKNSIEIGIDNYRMYHPRYLEIEKCIKEHWKNREETINDTPGNDIADFTHFFAGAMTDKLIEMGKNNKYNMLLEWGMREPNGPLKCMEDLKTSNYNNIVLFVATNKEVSYQACSLRTHIMKDSKHIIRKVPKSFHDYSVSTLPDSINQIYNVGKDKNIIDYMAIVNRNNEIVWDNKLIELPGTVYYNYLNNQDYIDKNNSLFALKTNERELEGLEINDLKGIKEFITYIDPEILNEKNTVK